MDDHREREGKAIIVSWKLLVLICAIFFVFVIYLVRLFNIQVINTFVFSRRSYHTIHSFHPQEGPRGRILDTEGQVLAYNQLRFRLFLNSIRYSHRLYPLGSLVYQDLIENLELPPQQFEQIYRLGSQRFPLKEQLELIDLQFLVEKHTIYPDLYFEPYPFRIYELQQKESLAHILGYIGKIHHRQYLREYGKAYTPQSLVGQAGVEAQYESLLRGNPGEVRFLINAVSNRIEERYETIQPIPGQDISLAIEASWQEVLQQAMGDRVGAALLLNPRTGAIRASVSYPYYKANAFYQDPQAFQQQNRQEHAPFLNRIIQSAYPPGSVFKIVMATAALSEESWDADLKIECLGFLQLGNRTFHDHDIHGWVDLQQALAQSCDVYFYKLAIHLGLDLLWHYAEEFGFAQATGVDLPGERKGLFPPSEEWKWEHYQDPWTDGDAANLGIGQGFLLATPLQIANMMALVVNEGILYTPYVVENTGEQAVEPVILRRSSIDKEVFQKVKEYLIYAVHHGSFRGVITTPLTVGGKTGTAQTITDNTEDMLHSWFVAFVEPYSALQEFLVFAAIVEGVNPWEWRAPKMANVVFHAIAHDLTFSESLDDLWPFYRQDLLPDALPISQEEIN